MIATGVLGAFNAVTGFVIMILLGIPFALPVAVLSFFGGFIPYIGQFVTSPIAFLITVAFGTTQDIIFMALWTAVFNIVQGSVIAPLVYGRAVSLHPAIVLIVIPAGYTLAGVLGMFLAVPVVGIAGAVWRHVLAAIGEIPPSVPDPDADADTGRDARRRSRHRQPHRSRRPSTCERAGRRRPARRAVVVRRPPRCQAGCGLTSAIGWPGPR